MGSLDEINPALLPPMARMKAIYIPNIASIAPPQMDNTFPSALRGLVGEEEHQSVIEEVNEELRSGLCLSEFENQEGQMERMRGPSIGLGVVWLVGLGLLGLGLEVGNGFLLAMGLVVVLPIFFILLGAGGYWVYLTSKQAKMCQDIEERVHDLSERRFSNRFGVVGGGREGVWCGVGGGGGGELKREKREGGKERREREFRRGDIFFYLYSEYFLFLINTPIHTTNTTKQKTEEFIITLL